MHPQLHPQFLHSQLLFPLDVELLFGILFEIPAKNSGFFGCAKMSIGKSRFSKKSHGFNEETSSHSSGMWIYKYKVLKKI